MKTSSLNWLVCPSCRGELTLDGRSGDAAQVSEGELHCAQCARTYPIVRDIPRFVANEGYTGSFGRQWNRHARLQLDSQNGTSFSRERFYSITEWTPAALEGRLVLDAGCGAGRFSEIALQAGAEVVAVDLSTAIDACHRNLGANSRLHCLQGSITELPLRDGSFDFVYCIGVIQHTPNPKRSVLSLVQRVRPGGQIGLWIYELNWKSFVGTAAFKYGLRPVTKRMSLPSLESWSARIETLCWPINRWARHRGTAGKALMRLLPTASAHLTGVSLSDEEFREWVRLDTFDMYSPAHDHPQRFETVKRWLEEAGCNVAPRHPHGAVSITATRKE